MVSFLRSLARQRYRAEQIHYWWSSAGGSCFVVGDGPCRNGEGAVPDDGIVRVLVTIFGRQVRVAVEYGQVVQARGWGLSL
jgi:hypothetical protein